MPLEEQIGVCILSRLQLLFFRATDCVMVNGPCLVSRQRAGSHANWSHLVKRCELSNTLGGCEKQQQYDVEQLGIT